MKKVSDKERRTEYRISPTGFYGTVDAIASKSQAHRQLICAALSDHSCIIKMGEISLDIEATIDCLKGLGANIIFEEGFIRIFPIKNEYTEASLMENGEKKAELYCKESGSTLRFLLPIAGALGRKAVFKMEGRLSERPIEPLKSELESHGMKITKNGDQIETEGRLVAGAYVIPGNVSSQYISGLLMALPFLDGESSIEVIGECESEKYIEITEDVLRSSGIDIKKEKFSDEEDISGKVSIRYSIPGRQRYSFPKEAVTEGDWSNATFFLCMGALSEGGVSVNGLSLDSAQGDKMITEVMKRFGADVETEGRKITVKKNRLEGIELDAKDVPDMVPAISALAACAEGTTVIRNAERLRIKESDRLKAVAAMINSLGGMATETEDGLVIEGSKELKGGVVETFNDHRIAMAACILAGAASGDIIIKDPDCVNKSYPGFYSDLEKLKDKANREK